MKKLKFLEDELSKKAEKTDIMRLENDKAEKLYVEGEFKSISREIQQIKDWLNRLEDLIKNSSKSTNQITDLQFNQLTQRVDKLEERAMKVSSTNFADNRSSSIDESALRDLLTKFNSLHADVENLKN